MTPPENGTKQAIEDIREQVRRLWNEKASDSDLKHAVEDIKEIRTSLEAIERTVVGRVAERATEREAALRERKIDRRWMVGTILTATGLVIAAMAILLPTLSGGG